MIEEPFAFGDSGLHNVDPRSRIFWGMAYSVVVALCTRFDILIAAVCISFCLVIIARLNWGQVLKRLKPLFLFLLLIFLVLPLTYEGEILYRYHWVSFSEPGVMLSSRILLKSVAILLAFMALVATMTIATLGRSLKKLYLPEKLIQLLLMTYRYIYVIEQEYKTLQTAIKVRGFQPGTNLHTYKTYAYLAGMLFVKASLRAERVQQAMILRGFHGRFYSLDPYEYKGHNILFSMLMFIITAAFIIGENGWIQMIIPI